MTSTITIPECRRVTRSLNTYEIRIAFRFWFVYCLRLTVAQLDCFTKTKEYEEKKTIFLNGGILMRRKFISYLLNFDIKAKIEKLKRVQKRFEIRFKMEKNSKSWP